MATPIRFRRQASSPEHDLQTSLVSWWRKNVREPLIDEKNEAILAPGDAYLYAVPNAGKRANGAKNLDAPSAWWLIAEGLRAGVSDLVLMIHGGRTVYVEVKTDTTLVTTRTYQNADQRKFEATCVALGFPYRVCRSLEEFASILDEFGVRYIARPFSPAMLRPRSGSRPAPSAGPPASARAGRPSADPGRSASGDAPADPPPMAPSQPRKARAPRRR